MATPKVQLPTAEGTELTPGRYLITFPAYQIASAIQSSADWKKRAAEKLMDDNDKVKATFVGGGFVNLPGQPPGAFYQVELHLEPADGVNSEAIGLVHLTIGLIVSSLLIVLAIQYLQVTMVEKLTELATTPAAENLSKGIKWLGVAAVIAAAAVVLSLVT